MRGRWAWLQIGQECWSLCRRLAGAVLPGSEHVAGRHATLYVDGARAPHTQVAANRAAFNAHTNRNPYSDNALIQQAVSYRHGSIIYISPPTQQLRFFKISDKTRCSFLRVASPCAPWVVHCTTYAMTSASTAAVMTVGRTTFAEAVQGLCITV
jgi:hypothetical protein